MAIPWVNVVEGVFSAAQYDGSNGAELVAAVGGTMVSDSGELLVFNDNVDTNRTMDAGDWMIRRFDLFPSGGIITNADYISGKLRRVAMYEDLPPA